MRPRKSDRHLPRSVYLSHGAYYYVSKGKWTPLGRDLGVALAEYGRIISAPKGGMAELIEQAFPHITRKVSASTAKQYRHAANALSKMLAEFSPEQVRTRDVAKIKRGLADTPNWANRIITVARLTFAWAVDEQLLDSNPCNDIKRLEEKQREKLPSLEEFAAVYAKADARLQIIMDLLRLTGQRVTDVLRIHITDLSDDGIYFRQIKTGARLIVQWTPELRAVVARAKALQGNVRALTLLHNRRGKAPDYSTIKEQWDEARRAAGVENMQMRDLRAMALTEADSEGLNATALAGHTSPNMTKRYLRSKKVPVVSGPSFRRLFGKQEKG
jgi:integrase